MTIARSNPYLHVTWLAKALVGERNCLWAHCYKTSHEGNARMPNDFDSAHWHIEHTALLDQQLAVELEEQGCQNRQNDFRVEISRSGMVISGAPDVIAVHPDGRDHDIRCENWTSAGILHRTGANLHVPIAMSAGWALERHEI